MAKKPPHHPEAKGLLLIASCALVLCALISFRMGHMEANWLGFIGYWVAYGLMYVFGLVSYLLVGFATWCALQLLRRQAIPLFGFKALSLGVLAISLCMLLTVFAESTYSYVKLLDEKVISQTAYFAGYRYTRYNLGGAPWYMLYRDIPALNFRHLLSNVGIVLIFTMTSAVSLILLTGVRITDAFNQIKKWILQGWSYLIKQAKKIKIKRPPQIKKATPKPAVVNHLQIKKKVTDFFKHPPQAEKPEPIASPVDQQIKMHKAVEVTRSAHTKREAAIKEQRVWNGDFAHYKLPALNTLKDPVNIDHPTLEKDLRRQAQILEETLESFGIEAKVGEINCGPTITSFEVHPAVGVKVQKITALENDIALNLQAKSLRIIAPIPGKAAVGVEIPSLYPQPVCFKELLAAHHESGKKMNLPLLLGKNITGNNVITDLTKMPHCIIAGATGSGKSVCINTIIMSILMNKRPDEVKLILVDPKKVELTPYSQLPHLIAPVITEAHGAYTALNWMVKEMLARYDLLKALGLRNIAAFNERKINHEKEAELPMDVPEKMHLIVAIIDEFADLMMASSSDLETPIARIAQMARAVGIHLILATQRPSREVITGLIKANFPTRISFKVSSRVNSQIILDENGAETLLGNGDMLFLPPGSHSLLRAQGAYISDEEINKVVSLITAQAPPNYLIKSFDNLSREEIMGEEGVSEQPKDDMYDKALALVLSTGTASTTFMQRKLKIGYARAASLMDELETRGVIGPQEGAKPRQVLGR